jgi:Predicted ring-cleavage extradiol dioxygenase
MTRPAHLAHVVMRTSNYQPMLDWYTALLSAQTTFGNEIVSFLTYDEEHHRVAIINIPGLKKPEPGTQGFDHCAFTYASLNDLLSNYTRLKDEHGIEPFWCINHGPTTSMYYRDPDGNQVELQVDNFPTVEEATKFFYTDEFAENPIGVDFDPEELMRRLAAGDSEEELKRRPNIGPRGMGDDVPLQ